MKHFIHFNLVKDDLIVS